MIQRRHGQLIITSNKNAPFNTMKKTKSIESLPIDSTKLCCNFVNTLYSWKQEDTYDFLTDYDTFIDWCVKAAVCKEDHLIQLRQQAKKEPGEAIIAMKKIREVRLLLHQLISAIAGNDQVKIAQFLAVVNPFITDALSRINLEFSGNTFTIAYQKKPIQLISPIWWVAKSLYDLLTEDDIVRIKECPSCGWVFFDETKNGKRRWCNPLHCGTKDKMDRYTKKLKAESDKQQ
jgi:predicted RNA-binding Zn ribbon-like protein